MVGAAKRRVGTSWGYRSGRADVKRKSPGSSDHGVCFTPEQRWDGAALTTLYAVNGRNSWPERQPAQSHASLEFCGLADLGLDGCGTPFAAGLRSRYLSISADAMSLRNLDTVPRTTAYLMYRASRPFAGCWGEEFVVFVR